MSNTLSDEVIDFLSRRQAVPRERLTLETHLREDLGMEGDDASEFLEDFSKRFGVDFSEFNFDRHFGPEVAFNPVLLFIGFVFKRPSRLHPDLGKYPITVKHLILIAENKHWSLPDRKDKS